MTRVTTFLFGLASGVAIFALSLYVWNSNKMTKVHTLKQPLLVSSNAAGKALHILPVGSTLYLDRSVPEGFTRYKIYVNVDRMPLTLRELADPNEIDPLEARGFDKPALMQALRDYPLSRQELAAILQSPQLTKQEIQEVFNQYLQESE
jgi:hypothetical protein